MKSPKKLTRVQKNFLRQQKLNPSNYFVVKNTTTEFVVINKKFLNKSNKTRCFCKKTYKIKF